MVLAPYAGAAELDATSQQRNSVVTQEQRAVSELAAQQGRVATEVPSRGQAKSDASAKSAVPIANGRRAYAPSCLAYRAPEGLPLTTSGPVYPTSAPLRMRLAAIEQGNSNYVSELVDIDIWRVPCSSSGQFYEAVTLMRIKRDPSNEGRVTRYPLFPGIRVSQSPFANDLFVRVAEEPNTFREHVMADTPVIDSTTYVLENFSYVSPDTALFDFNNAFSIRFDNFFTDGSTRYGTISVPTYTASATDYPTRGGPLPINGYLTGNWFDETHSGEGMLVQVFDLPGNTTQVLFTFAWFTFGPDGRPFWLFGATQVNHDQRGPISVPTIFQTGGGFAGNFGPSAQQNTWGTVTFRFPHCYQMVFDYASTTTAANVPLGSGTRTWTRPVNTNALTCE
ncbi:MAG TPA: hypothetical protein VLF18_20910 [Tahibacter sp.]|uniref:hypothetical protein n=1 Tax=Tahibacter sp. TaxID=2056211 RepID=UPI002CE48ADF|nr:hypothetical protein [Tahibacter sp.]HSX62651.1 hypothetical protein [Tahibacter sp.]